MAECKECGFMYAEGEPSDEAEHRKHHKKHQQGVRVRGPLASRRVLSERHDGDRVVMLRPGDGTDAVRKLLEIRTTLEAALGPSSSGSSSSGRRDLGGEDVSGDLELPTGLQAYLFLEAHTGRVRGCAFAEAIDSAYCAVPPQAPSTEHGSEHHGSSDAATHGDEADHITAVLRHDGVSVAAQVGISHIWVDARDRRKGVGTALLDAVRRHFATGFDIPKDRLAFSQPTALGRRLAANYSGGEAFLVYE